jgi:ABC-type glycerol-3-phosphate transport system permease component
MTRLERTLLVGGLSVVSLIMLFPLYWMATSGLKSRRELARIPPTLWPEQPIWSNFPDAWGTAPFWRYTLNSAVVAGGTVIGVLVFSTLAGFAFARYRFRGQRLMFAIVLITLMIPGQITAIPLYLQMRDLHLLNHPAAVILPSLAGGFGTFLMRQYISSLPRELLEAARIDGAGEFRVFWQIVLPQLGPAIAALVIFTFMSSWDGFFWPLIVFSSPEKYTLPVGVALFQGQFTSNESYVMAISTLTSIPVLVVFALAQRRFVEGIALSGFK